MLIYVIGLSMLTAFAVLNLNKTSLSSQDTFSMYFSKSMVHNIALAGANIGTHLCLNDTAYSTNLTNQAFNGGSYDITITKSGDSTRIRSIGHVPTRYYDYAVGSWKTEMLDTVEAKLQRLYFSRYGYFSGSETNGYMSPTSNAIPGGSMWKVTGDSMYGPVHTNGGWNFSGQPYFDSKVTAANNPTLSNFVGPPNPIYNGGYQWGVTVGRPIARLNEIENGASSGGKLWTAASTGNQDLRLTFNSAGSVRVRIPWNTGGTKDTTYASISSLAPNGIIAVKGIDVRVEGTYNGKATILARTTGSSGNLKGNIWIQGDLVAADNPKTNNNSDDILGLVSERMTYVTTTGISRTSTSQTNIQAAIYCHNGVFAVENYTACGIDGRLNLFGGATMNASTSTGVISGGVLTNGMLKSFRHDPRFLTKAPPSFPFSDKYQLVAWWEN